MTRKRRGMRTQALLAQRWRHSGWFPYAQDQGAGRPGRDILNTPGYFVEVKARGRLTLLETLRKAEQDAEKGELAFVVWRHNGQGEESVDDWTVTVRLHVFEDLMHTIEKGARRGS